VFFIARAGHTYRVWTSELGAQANTYLFLHNNQPWLPNSVLAANSNYAPPEKWSRVEYTVSTPGPYYVRVESHFGTFGPESDYNLQVLEFSPTPPPVDPTPPPPEMTPLEAWLPGDTATVHWYASAAGQTLQYQPEVSDDPAFPYPYPLSWTNLSRATFTGLQHGDQYFYRVKARNQWGIEGPYSNVVYASQDALAPSSRLLPVVPPFDVLQVDMNIDLSDSGSGVDFFEVYYRHDFGPTTRYPGTFSNRPHTFDASLTGAWGRYDLYSVATDRVGNREAPPTSIEITFELLTTPTPPSPTSTATPTPTVTPTPSATPSPTATATATATRPFTVTPTASPTPTATATPAQRAVISLGGYMSTRLTTDGGGTLHLLVLAVNADAVELGLNGAPVGLPLSETDPVNGVFALGPMVLGPAPRTRLTVECIPSWQGTTGDLWPYLVVR
jgi:hypothetical protein